jgi:hypothetical protein
VDEFDGTGSLGAPWEVTASDSQIVSRVDGTLHVPAEPNDDSNVAGASSSATYDLRDCYLHFELLAVPDQASEGFVDGYLWDYENALGFTVSGDQLRFLYANSGVEFSAGAARDYDSVEHRWLRVREAGGTMYWEVSSDGSGWNAVATENSGFAIQLSRVEVRLEAGTRAASADPGVAVFDNVNAEPVTR